MFSKVLKKIIGWFWKVFRRIFIDLVFCSISPITLWLRKTKRNIVFSMKKYASQRFGKDDGRFSSYYLIENYGIFHFYEQLEILLRVQETGTAQNVKLKNFHKHWKVGAQTSTKFAILVIEDVLHGRNSVEKTWFSKMIFCSLRGTSVLSWQDHVQKDKKRSRIASKTLISENSL